MMLETELRQRSGAAPAPTTVATPSAPRARIETTTLIMNAKVLLQHGETELSLNLLREASNREPNNRVVLRTLAEALEKSGKTVEVLKVREALRRYDPSFENTYGWAQSLYKLGRDEEALGAYYEALATADEAHAALFEIHKNMGNIFVRRGDFEGAQESYNKAYCLNPRSDVLMVNLGTLEVQRGDFSKSLVCFRQAVEINPGNDRAWTGLAMVHHEFGDRELAWGNLERAMDLNPGNRTAVHLASNWAVRDGQPQRMLERMQTYLASVESDEEMSLVLIQLFCSAGRLDLASLETSRVQAWNPEREDVAQLAQKLREMGL